MAIAKLYNLILFTAIALWRGTPYRLWPQAWRDVQADHLAEVRKAVWQRKKEARVREDRDGRLWRK